MLLLCRPVHLNFVAGDVTTLKAFPPEFRCAGDVTILKGCPPEFYCAGDVTTLKLVHLNFVWLVMLLF